MICFNSTVDKDMQDPGPTQRFKNSLCKGTQGRGVLRITPTPGVLVISEKCFLGFFVLVIEIVENGRARDFASILYTSNAIQPSNWPFHSRVDGKGQQQGLGGRRHETKNYDSCQSIYSLILARILLKGLVRSRDVYTEIGATYSESRKRVYSSSPTLRGLPPN